VRTTSRAFFDTRRRVLLKAIPKVMGKPVMTTTSPVDTGADDEFDDTDDL
jgi:hypothetical protein